jgi:hypothetical protein
MAFGQDVATLPLGCSVRWRGRDPAWRSGRSFSPFWRWPQLGLRGFPARRCLCELGLQGVGAAGTAAARVHGPYKSRVPAAAVTAVPVPGAPASGN